MRVFKAKSVPAIYLIDGEGDVWMLDRRGGQNRYTMYDPDYDELDTDDGFVRMKESTIARRYGGIVQRVCSKHRGHLLMALEREGRIYDSV